jgi:hypothetical protein
MKKTPSQQKSSKLKITITLDEEDSALLQAAWPISRKITREELDRTSARSFNGERKWFILWALRAVATEVIRTQGMPCPLGVDLRKEHPADTEARVGGNRAPAKAEAAESKAADNPVTKALTFFRRKFWDHANHGKVVGLDTVAKTVLRTALAHPKELEAWIGAAADYREAEGFGSHEQVELSFIAGRKEYRRVKISA